MVSEPLWLSSLVGDKGLFVNEYVREPWLFDTLFVRDVLLDLVELSSRLGETV